MDIFVLGREVITLFVSMSVNLIIHFNEPMNAAGGSEHFEITPINQNKSFIINARDKDFESNMVFFNDDEQFNVIIKHSDKFAHDFVNLVQGQRNDSFVLRFENEKFRILEGSTSSLVENKTKNRIRINGREVQTNLYVSRGAPIFIEVEGRKYLLNHGRSL